MRKNKSLLLLASIILVVILVLASGVFKAQKNVVEILPDQNSALPYTIDTYGNAWDGPIAFGLSGPNGVNYLVIMDTNGTLLDLRTSTGGYGVVKNLAQNTFLFEGEPQLSSGAPIAPNWGTNIWNVASNTTQNFPNVISHHDVDYNPINNTFLTLQDYVRQVGNNFYLIDKILEVNAQGNVLWTWDAYNYLPLSDADPFNNTSTYNGQPVIDFTHTNALLWDYNNNVIYLNVRNTNTFYKIDQTTGNIIWGCGQFGNFTLVDANGSVLPNGQSLFYHSHDLEQVAPDVFTMFNDDFDNVTNYNDANSQMIEFTLNEKTMTATIIRSWTAPQQYYSSYLGATDLLPNGDWIGDFGTPTHQFTENQPWNFVNLGAALIDVNSAGQIMRTITFPVGWAIYRNQVVTNVTADALSPIPTPTLSPSASAAPTPSSGSAISSFPCQSTTVAPTTTSTPTSTSAPGVTQTPTTKPSAIASSKLLSSIEALIVTIAAIVIVIIAVTLAYVRKRKTKKG